MPHQKLDLDQLSDVLRKLADAVDLVRLEQQHNLIQDCQLSEQENRIVELEKKCKEILQMRYIQKTQRKE